MINLLRLTIILIPHLIIFDAFGQHHVAIKTNVSTAQLLRCEVKDGVLTETFEILASADSAGMISWSHDKFSKKWRSVCITAENFKTVTRQLEKLDFQEFEVKLYHTKAYLTQRKKDLSQNPGVINYSLFLEECFDDPDWESNYHIYLRKKAIYGRTELSSIVKSANEINDICEGLNQLKTQLAKPLNEFPLGNAPSPYTTLIQEISTLRKDLDSWDVLSEIQLPTFNEYLPKTYVNELLKATVKIKLKEAKVDFIATFLETASSPTPPAWMSHIPGLEFQEVIANSLMDMAIACRDSPNQKNIDQLIAILDTVYFNDEKTVTTRSWSKYTQVQKDWHRMHELYWNPERQNSRSIQYDFNQLYEEQVMVIQEANAYAPEDLSETPWHPWCNRKFIMSWRDYINAQPMNPISATLYAQQVREYMENGQISNQALNKAELALLGIDGGLKDSLVQWSAEEKLNIKDTITIPAPSLLRLLPEEVTPFMTEENRPLWQTMLPDSIPAIDFKMTLDSATNPTFLFQGGLAIQSFESNIDTSQSIRIRSWTLRDSSHQLTSQSVAIEDSTGQRFLDPISLIMVDSMIHFQSLLDIQAAMDSIDAWNGLKKSQPVSHLNRESVNTLSSVSLELEDLEQTYLASDNRDTALNFLIHPFPASDFETLQLRHRGMDSRANSIRQAIERQEILDKKARKKYYGRIFRSGYVYIEFKYSDDEGYETYQKSSELRSAESCWGGGSWRVEGDKVILSPNSSSCESNRFVYGTYKLGSNWIEGDDTYYEIYNNGSLLYDRRPTEDRGKSH